MKRLKYLYLYFFVCISLNGQNSTIKSLVDFLKDQRHTAKEYVINQFKDNDIVILCERHHAEIEQYNLFLDIIKDPYFIKNVGTVYMEVGVANLSPAINSFLLSEGLDSSEINIAVTKLFRNADYNPIWFTHSYPWLLREIHILNRKLDKKRKINLYGCDISFDWERCLNEEEYMKLGPIIEERDSIIAENFIRQYKTQKKRNGNKKALVILNFRHAFLKDTSFDENTIRKNTGRYLKEEFEDKVASIYIMGLGHPHSWDEYTVLKEGMWDASFELAGKTNIGFDLKNTSFGKAPFDVTPTGWTIDELRYQDIFTGLIYYKPIEKHTLKTGWPGAFTESFRSELIRRLTIAGEKDVEITQEDIDYINIIEESAYENLQECRDKINKWK